MSPLRPQPADESSQTAVVRGPRVCSPSRDFDYHGFSGIQILATRDISILLHSNGDNKMRSIWTVGTCPVPSDDTAAVDGWVGGDTAGRFLLSIASDTSLTS